MTPYWPRLLKRTDACRYVSMTAAEFEKAVGLGEMPMPRKIGTVERWDREAIDKALDGDAGDWRKDQPIYKRKGMAA